MDTKAEQRPNDAIGTQRKITGANREIMRKDAPTTETPKGGNVHAYSMFLRGTRCGFGKDKHCNAFLSADET